MGEREGREGCYSGGEGEVCKRRKFLVAAKMRQKGTILKRRRGEACNRRKFLVAAKMRQKGTILLRGGEEKRGGGEREVEREGGEGL